MERIEFSVDAALLRELGERLVGRPHIALAELIKNAYDADATRVVIRFGGEDIEVEDNGHGMTFDEFRDGWMRVGTPSKQRQAYSRHLHRSLTGSKGVGRLSSQFLARHLELRTVSETDPSSELRASIDWSEAIMSDELSKASALFEIDTPGTPVTDDRGRTVIRLKDLNQVWDTKGFELLARELWALQPPFLLTTDEEIDAVDGFVVTLEVEANPEIGEVFERSMSNVLELDMARIRGRLVHSDEGPSSVQMALTFNDGEHLTETYACDDNLSALDFEIRVFDLRGRQDHGIKVDEARAYLRNFGGVHVYDAGFHMPYYGVDTDWLDIEKDHARRYSKSQLLPEALQISGGMTHLPTNRRLFGVVKVDTAREGGADRKSTTTKPLAIQVTRDRLLDNESYRELKRIVRWALDYFAHQQARRVFAKRPAKPTRGSSQDGERVALDTLEMFRGDIPEHAYEMLADAVTTATSNAQAEIEIARQQAGLLGALATAGMATIAYEHELAKQLRALERTAASLRDGSKVDPERLADRIDAWLARARGTQALFSQLIDEEDRETVKTFTAVTVVNATLQQVRPILGDLVVDTTEIDPTVELPPGRYSEWTSVLQNLFFNAHDATLQRKVQQIRVRSDANRRRQSLIVEDNGVGVDLDTSAELFEPFAKRLELPADVRRLRLGSSGLGLTIVKMICDELNCEVQFVPAEEPYATAVEITWRRS